jgi:hypothetical protein
MSIKIDPELLRQIDAAKKTQTQQEIPVIVTITPGADLAPLEARGLKIERTFENISAVAGKLKWTEIDNIALLDQVERIEYDGQMQALSGS